MDRRRFLAGMGLASMAPWLTATTTSSRARLIVVHAWGGWDVTFALDPKARELVDGPYVDEDPADPTDVAAVQTFHGLPILVDAVRRPAVSTFFANHGASTTLINGLQVGAVGHHDGVRRVLSGSAVPGRPDLPTIVGVGSELPLGVVDLSGAGDFGPYVASGARMGLRGQLRALLDPAIRYPAPADSPVQRPADLPPNARDAVRRWLDERLEAEAQRGDPSEHIAQRIESLERAQRLVDHGVAPSLPLGLREDLSANVDAALDLLDGGTCRAVLLDSGEPWDTHAEQTRQHTAYQGLFAGLGRLVAGLVARAMTDTKVLVVAEMSRSPRRNAEGGTEHWPTTSALWIDPARPVGGRLLGATDDRLLARAVDLGTGLPDASGVVPRYGHLAAAVLTACDVDPEPWLPGVTPYRALLG
jgi:hypothetical protein